MSKLQIYDSFSREKRAFAPIIEGIATMYVCGPTVYNDAHLGNCRTFTSFDILYRYLRHLGYKVRYVRNITDVGHLVGDVDCDAESKVEARARLEQVDPMEIVQKYSNRFHDMMHLLNNLPPSIEPTATGHLMEQIDMVRTLLKNGYAYTVNGSVYFDTQRLLQERDEYGKLSGKKVEELLEESRDNLRNQDEKRHPSDFALWVKASPSHLMRWETEWSVGYPGWHLECSAMSTKYLGKTFDIHGGGMDLKFPHHENEIAQNLGACGCLPANYWLHANMMLLNGKKMSKSDGNNVMPDELFKTGSPLLTRTYSPMTFRFLLLQTHYRSELNLTEAGLQGAEKAYQRVMKAYQRIKEAKEKGDYRQASEGATINTTIQPRLRDVDEQMNDDLNTAQALAVIFEILSLVGGEQLHFLTKENLHAVEEKLRVFLFDIFGLTDETQSASAGDEQLPAELMQLILDLRKDVRTRKDFATSDLIRDRLAAVGIQVKDTKEGATWERK